MRVPLCKNLRSRQFRVSAFAPLNFESPEVPTLLVLASLRTQNGSVAGFWKNLIENGLLASWQDRVSSIMQFCEWMSLLAWTVHLFERCVSIVAGTPSSSTLQLEESTPLVSISAATICHQRQQSKLPMVCYGMLWYVMVWYGIPRIAIFRSCVSLAMICPMYSTNDGREVHLGKQRLTHTSSWGRSFTGHWLWSKDCSEIENMSHLDVWKLPQPAVLWTWIFQLPQF